MNPHIVAHRGLHDIHIENSLAAFAAAWEAGIEWCECDVHASADGGAVVIHDATLDRTTGGRGVVAQMLTGDLPRIVPRLRAVLRAMPADRGMLIEIKPENNLRLVDAVLDEAAGHRCIIQSFYPANLFHAMKRTSDIAMLVESEEVLIAAAASPFVAVHVHQKLLNSPSIASIKRLGVWTVNTAEEISRALKFNPRMLITDQPLLAGKLCSGRCG